MCTLDKKIVLEGGGGVRGGDQIETESEEDRHDTRDERTLRNEAARVGVGRNKTRAPLWVALEEGGGVYDGHADPGVQALG